MINKIHSLLFRPERGWDPITPEYGKSYADMVWNNFDPSPIDMIEKEWGPVKGRKILDLGAGPGQYTAEFAKRGAQVIWYDVSQYYLTYARDRLSKIKSNYPITFVKGYLEDAQKLNERFDLVFNRVCFYYSISDFKFAKIIHNLIAPSGNAFIMANHLGFYKKINLILKLKIILNEVFHFKIGHPYCSKRKFQEIIARCEYKKIKYEFDGNIAYIWLSLE
jgi:2-polyprenyl-3-methyl-5-hydroxy-6-metoxy-1,4-benzoquinol methylase